MCIRRRPVGAALALGLCGGAFAQLLGVPMPWMLGPLFFVAFSAIAGMRVDIPDRMRNWMIAIIGVTLGGAFEPGMFGHDENWTYTLFSMTVCTIIMSVCGTSYLYLRARQDPLTAFFGGSPGNLSQMVLLASESRADLVAVSLAHSIRLSIVVLATPTIVFFWFGDSSTQPPQEALAFSLGHLGLVACLLGKPIAQWLRMPSAPLIGPLVVSGLLHYLGVIEVSTPAIAIHAAQLITGAAIGARFSGVSRSDILRLGTTAFGLTFILCAVGFLFAVLLWRTSNYSFGLLLISFLPGGASEMSLIALALGYDPAFVASHHLLRMILVVAAAPLILRLLNRVEATRGNRRAD